MNAAVKPVKKSKTVTLGPVENLEFHLQADWWRKIFNSVYLKTDGDVVEDKQITSDETDLFLSILQPHKEQSILDIACGQGRHVLELSRRGFQQVHGLDRSHYLIRKAKATSQMEGLSANFKEGDARKLPFPTDGFDFATILGNSFGYFENIEDDIKILQEIYRVLKPGGKLLLDITDGDFIRNNFSPRSWEWIDNKHFVCRERSMSENNDRLISREVVTHIQKGILVDQFYAERLYSKESIVQLLEKNGYTNIKLHGNVSPDSKRNQDLGMMEQRILITGSVIKEWAPVKLNGQRAKNVVVLLGDPNKNDRIKPDSVFDEDDFETIDKLKQSLQNITNYRFSYLNNHNSLLKDLLKMKNKIDFVFNLCDEGYQNEAKMELHIPALLEMLNIPYTGSNPQCLSYCYDKSLIRGIAQEMDIPVAKAFFIKPEDNIFDFPLDFPVIAKPNFGDSSFGITQDCVAESVEELNSAIIQIRNKFGYEKPILVEEFLTGKEITIGVIGNSPESYRFLPIIEEDYSQLPPNLPRICGYEAKWLIGSPYFNTLKSIPAVLDNDTEKNLFEYCLRLMERLECRDYCRFDWRFNANGEPHLLEVNPNPGWCWDGHLAKMAKFTDLSYSDMLKSILNAAENRIYKEYSIEKTSMIKTEINS